MKTEEAPCEGAPSLIKTSYPLYHVKDGLIEHSSHSAVTSSTLSIESPQTTNLYITPPPERPKKAKDLRLACLGHIQKLKGIPSTAKAILTWLVTIRQWRADRLIIVSFGLVADHFGLSRRQVIRLFQILEESGCLRIVKRGGIRGGIRYEGNTYALGSLFDNLPSEESKKRPVTKMSPIKGNPSVTKISIEQCQGCHPLPILTPYKSTLTNNKSYNQSNNNREREPSALDSIAFNKETWLKACLNLNPSRDLEDIDHTFHLAENEGAKDGGWAHWAIRFDRCYQPLRKKPTAPERRARLNDNGINSCYSPPTYKVMGFKCREDWVKAGCP